MMVHILALLLAWCLLAVLLAPIVGGAFAAGHRADDDTTRRQRD